MIHLYFYLQYNKISDVFINFGARILTTVHVHKYKRMCSVIRL